MHRIIVFLIIISYALNSLASTNHWESLVNNGASVKYWSSNNGEPESNWRNKDYDDNAWTTGISGIGRGDNDDGTTINTCNGLAIRYTFQIKDLSKLSEACFYIDYDDAFVAYINGVEIARSSGLNANTPPLSTLSSAQHEAGTREEHLISAEQIANAFINGTNVLALQVHNASTTSSDMSSSAWLLAGIADGEHYYNATPSWFVAPFRFSSSNLPIILIDTENGQSISDEPKTTAQMRLINNPSGTNSVNDYPTDYDGFIGIEWRGNSTQNFPKKPYNFETRDALGENLNVPLFGWHKENDWVLRASYLDHTFIRNCLASEMSRLNGWWAPRTKLVELVLNDKYQGIYVLMEDIKPDKGRVNIEKMSTEDTTATSITGGYIWEITGFEHNMGSNRKLKYPKYDEATPEQIDYISHHDNDFRAAVQDVKDGNYDAIYAEWINRASFINELLIQEAMRNGDAYGWSGYFHKDRGGKINAGPVWDFDQSSGNSSYPDNAVVSGWLFEHPSKSSTPAFWPTFFKDPEFAYVVRKRWEELRSNAFSDHNLTNYIDSLSYLLREAQEREFITWPVLAANVWRETTAYENRDTYKKEVDYLKSFLHDRWLWMDEELSQYENPNPNTGFVTNGYSLAQDCHIYPNPANTLVHLHFDNANIQMLSVELINNLGLVVQKETIANKNTARLTFSDHLPNGIYYIKIRTKKDETVVKRILKTD